MVAMEEELGSDMAIRSLEHLLQYGEDNIRRAVPLALGLLCISNPKVRRFGVPNITQENGPVSAGYICSLCIAE